ncbi:heme-copper oxidase subunit III [Sphingomonas sp. GCM10030256]|uniref:heme-copper oxidase subunit III n=1 Tax=Sphingomonas sp. GCM10030256 TaxID=3273427 RepID=UPI00360B941A
MSLFTRLTEKSWESRPAVPDTDRPPAAKVMLILYFGVAAVLFGLVTSAYLMRMGMPGMAHGPLGGWRALPELPLLWVNTGILLLGSVAWEGARTIARKRLFRWVFAAGLLGLLFLAGQLLLWRQLTDDGRFLRGDPAAAFFYLITALHGLHVLGGLYFWARAIAALGTGGGALRVQLTATYWHFLLLVWLVMLGLFLAT